MKKKLITCLEEDDVSNLTSYTKSIHGTNFSLPEGIFNGDKTLSSKNLSALHICAAFDSIDCFIYIQNYLKAEDFTIQNLENSTPLHYACYFNSYEVASFILDYGFSIPSQKKKLEKLFQDDYKEKTKYSLINLASLSSSPKIIKILFKYGYSLSKFKNHRQILDQCIRNSVIRRDSESLYLLLTLKNDINVDNSPLMTAITAQNIDAVKLLLDLSPNLNYYNSRYETALSIACLWNNYDIVRILLDNMSEIDLPPQLQVKAAVHWMCQSGNPKICRLMLDRGIDVNRLDQEGRPGLFYLTTNVKEDVLAILNMMYQHRMIIDQKENNPITKFTSSIGNYSYAIEWFITHGTSLETLVKPDMKLQTWINKQSRSEYSYKVLRELYID